MLDVFLEEESCPEYLLANDIGVVARLDFEGAVIRPEIDGICDACNSAFIDLTDVSSCDPFLSRHYTISAASVPAIENSRSAYFFQYPKNKGNLARKRS